MPRVVLQPCSGPAARQHFEDTIRRPVKIDNHLDLLTVDEANMLHDVSDTGELLVWGATPGETAQHVGKWSRISRGDYVFFAQDGHLFAWAIITAVLRNHQLAQELWGTTTSRNGREMTWELMFGMTELTYFTLAYADLNRFVGRKPSAAVQEFNVLPEEASSVLLDALGLGDNEFIADPSFAEYESTVLTASFEATEREVITKQRTEQQLLRRVLFGRSTVGTCELCGREFSIEFLSAAHIKRRSACTDGEKRDIYNIAMANCRFGCDELYGRGYITVSNKGEVILSAALDPASASGQYAMTHLANRKIDLWRRAPATHPYFQSHEETEFRFAPDTENVAPSIS